jgi:hypothetical protein
VSIDPKTALQQAARRGFIAEPFMYTALGGNADRNPRLARQHLHVREGSGRAIKLTIGAGLSSICERAERFRDALPAHAAATLFFFTDKGLDVWAQEWIEGPEIESPVENIAAAAKSLRALAELETALARTSRKSPTAAWENEFRDWRNRIVAAPVWTPAEAALVEKDILPYLASGLRPDSTESRWSSGDFVSSNLKLGPGGRAVIVDLEFAHETHFHAEDHVRFSRLSPIAHTHPGLFAGLWPNPAPAWEIFFQLRQLLLELEVNSPAYLTREIPRRKGNLRFAAESAGLRLTGWPTPAIAPAPDFASETVQLFWESPQGWSEAHSRRIAVRRGVPQFFAFRIPPDARSLRLDPAASARSVILRQLCTLGANGELADCTAGCEADGAKLVRTGNGETRVEPLHADPQLRLPPSNGAEFLLGEMIIDDAER